MFEHSPPFSTNRHFILYIFTYTWVLAQYMSGKISLAIHPCIQALSDSKKLFRQWLDFLRQHFQRYNVMTILDTMSPPFCPFRFRWHWPMAYDYQKTRALKKTAEAYCLNCRLWKTSPKVTTLDCWFQNCWWKQWTVKDVWFVLNVFTMIDGPDLAS